MNKTLDERCGAIWLDGEIIDSQDARIHILSHTLHYGSGVFEGERAYNGQIFKKTEHHQRLHDSASMLGFNIPYSVKELDHAADQVLIRNQFKNAYVRPIAWHGAESLSVASYNNTVHVAIAAWEWQSYFTPGVTGLKLTWSDWIRPAPDMSPVFAKANGQYITGTMSKNKAEKQGYHDALMLDYRGYVAECTGANIFMVKNNILYTPTPDCFLNGITRQTIIELAKSFNITVIEKYILPNDLMEADEIFLTGTAVEVQPVIKIDRTHFNTGPITIKLQHAYSQLVNGEHNG